jgi:transposase
MDYFIKKEEWKHILGILSQRKDIYTKNEEKLRVFIEAVWYITRSGCQWRLLPKCYNSWRAVHQRFKRWNDKGIWEELFYKSQIDPDKEVIMIDATIVRAHACAAGYGKDSQAREALGRSRGGFSTKIHAMVDGLGNPLKFILSPGQRHEISQADTLIEDIFQSILVADKGYDSDAFVSAVKTKECHAVIPPKRNRRVLREYDEHIYKERHLIECFFGKLKHFRRCFSRFDKSGTVFLAFLAFASVFIWLR